MYLFAPRSRINLEGSSATRKLEYCEAPVSRRRSSDIARREKGEAPAGAVSFPASRLGEGKARRVSRGEIYSAVVDAASAESRQPRARDTYWKRRSLAPRSRPGYIAVDSSRSPLAPRASCKVTGFHAGGKLASAEPAHPPVTTACDTYYGRTNFSTFFLRACTACTVSDTRHGLYCAARGLSKITRKSTIYWVLFDFFFFQFGSSNSVLDAVCKELCEM